MPDAENAAENKQEKGRKKPFVLAALLALVGAAGGFYTTWSGMILSEESKSHDQEEAAILTAPDVAYVEMEPLVISLREPTNSKHLRFRAQLEVPTQYKADVEQLIPRVIDVLNSYLRALETADIEAAASLVRLRAQMLRRVQVVVGRERVNDLLVMEFVLN